MIAWSALYIIKEEFIMKKIVSGILALTLVFGSAAALPQGAFFGESAITASADSYGSYYGFGYTSYDDGSVMLTSYTEDADKIVTIPSVVNGSNRISLSSDLVTYFNTKSPAEGLKVGPDYEVFNSYRDFYYAKDGAVYMTREGDTKVDSLPVIIPYGMKELTLANNLSSLLNPYGMPIIANHKNLMYINMPEDIQSLGYYSLFNLVNLKRVEFPKNMKITLTDLRESQLGYCFVNGSSVKNTSFVISCYKGSAAEQYAKEQGFRCWIIDADEEEDTNGLIDINDMKFTLNKKKYVCTGSDNVKPNFTIKNGSDVLQEGLDYNVTVTRTDQIGTAVITVKGIGSYTGEFQKNIEIIPADVTGFSGSAYSKSATHLRWNPVVGAEGYIVYAYDSKAKTYKRIAVLNDGSTSEYFNWSLKAGTTYKYAIKAFGVAGANREVTSAKFPTVNVSTKPENVSFKVTAGSGKATVKWSKTTGAKGYRVYYKTSKNGAWKKLTTTNKTSFTKSGLKSGQTYYFAVKAYRKVDGVTYWGGFNTKSVKVK